MLPEISETVIDVEEIEETSRVQGKSFLFDFSAGEFVIKDGRVVKTADIEAIKIWINNVLRTERFRFEIYGNDEYGISLEDLIGQNLPRSFVESELRREIKEAIERHPNISRVEKMEMVREGSWLRVNLEVVLEENITFSQEVII